LNPEELKQRTKCFALRVMKLVGALPRTAAGRTVAQQLARSGTSVGANYRAACKARSRAEFAARMGTVEEEADESAYWMELIVEGGLMKEELVQPLHEEAEQLAAIAASSRKSAVRGKGRPPAGSV